MPKKASSLGLHRMKLSIDHAEPSPWCDERPPATVIDTILVHSMFAPGHTEPFSLEACTLLLDSVKLSAHYLIDPAGHVRCLVPEEKRAWHAGRSQLPLPDGRDECNFFSIGVELLGDPEVGFKDAQYRALGVLCNQIRSRHPIRFILGHEHVAVPQGRKVDPGKNFDWKRLQRDLKKSRKKVAVPFKELVFPAA